MPKIPVSLSSEVVPEMQEYERTITTVANSYVRPKVAEYVKNLQNGLKRRMKNVNSGFSDQMVVLHQRKRHQTHLLIF